MAAPFIIFGTRGVTSTHGKGRFWCPRCRDERPYAHKSVRTFFTLYFIPLIPVSGRDPYVECGRCRTAFEPGVLDQRAPEPEQPDFDYAFQRASLRVMSLFVTSKQRAQRAQAEFAEHFRAAVSVNDILEIRAQSKEDFDGVLKDLGELQFELEPEERERVIACAARVGHPLTDNGRRALVRIGEVLELPAGDVDVLMSQVE